MGEIEVRHGEPGDYAGIHAIYQQSKAIWGTLQNPFPSEEMWRERMAHPPEGLKHLVAVIDGEVVGQLGLKAYPGMRRRHAATLGMAVRDDWAGKGVGTALMAAAMDMADNWMNLTRVELTVFTDNEPAIALYRKFGFEIEGTQRKYGLREGELHDTYLMARIRDL